MKFVVSRTSLPWDRGQQPHDRARKETFAITRSIAESYLNHGDALDRWYAEGRNHREFMRGDVTILAREQYEDFWVMEIETLDELYALHQEMGDLVIQSPTHPLDGIAAEIEIYDDYRE